ncbi:MAG: hypothetical protein PHU27_04130 [Salinivirgaceae bacterium]|nr:hypothetical protein [Salinivirgaceae bacterium]MDD4746182.1 hypothetical protein [Salinivirgaceae bacterium]MDY0281741.1 hypothetical protein [Salinivirgaceae bacterium]
MNKIKIIIIGLVLAFIMNACTKPEDPATSQVITGEWVVENVIADGQVNIPGVFSIDAVLHLDSNGSFLFVNVDGRASAGTWIATGTELLLNGSDGYVQNFTVVYTNWEKMHIFRTLSIAQGANVELRYLFRRR